MISPRAIFTTLLLVPFLFGVPSTLLAFEPPPPVFVQALVGAAQFAEDDMTFAETSISDDATESFNDLSNLPYLGMTIQYPFHGENTQIGMDGSILFGWQSKDTRISGGNGQIAISLDSSLWLADLAGGVYVKHTFNDRWRIYAAVGPTLVFGEYSEDFDEEDTLNDTQTKSSNSDSVFGVGVYARSGFDYQFAANAYVGVCVRGLKTNVEFDNAPKASSGLSGVQGFFTFSRYF